jgi:hypothetical protein
VTPRVYGLGIIIGLFVTLAMTCQRSALPAGAGVAPDSLTGIVSITGTAFEQQIVLRSGNTATVLSAAGPDSTALSRLGGIEVLIVGSRSPRVFRVERFAALSVAGIPVVDGVLKRDGDGLVLETSSGRLRLGNPPAALRGMIDARVWIGGPLDRGPNTYGVIVPAP